MRRTPIFDRIKTDSGRPEEPARRTTLRRPNMVLGDYLENRRVLRALHSKFTYPELEGIIDNDESLDSFYLFDGTRFIKEKVLNIFNDSEYSFVNMLEYLTKKGFEEVEPIASEFSYNPRKFTDFLLSREHHGKYLNFEYLLENVSFIYSWMGRNDRLSFESYTADYNYVVNLGVPANNEFIKFQYLIKNWSMHTAFVTDENKRVKKILNFLAGMPRLSSEFGVKEFNEKMREIQFLFQHTFDPGVDNYIKLLSSGVNFPDDKNAEPEELEYVDEWLKMFESFYPMYERLLRWYISNKKVS